MAYGHKRKTRCLISPNSCGSCHDTSDHGSPCCLVTVGIVSVLFRAGARELFRLRAFRRAWQQRVQDARRRSEEFVANERNQTVGPQVSDKEDAEAADQRAMNDRSLRPGDIIATSRGFRIFAGRDSEEHRPSDFLPAPSPRDPR
jgi:hypothetical protein